MDFARSLLGSIKKTSEIRELSKTADIGEFSYYADLAVYIYNCKKKSTSSTLVCFYCIYIY